MANTQVICKSGLTGWQGHLRDQYNSYAEFQQADEIYGLATRLGYDWQDNSPAAYAWNDNPVVQGSVNPDDYCRVLTFKSTTVKVVVELRVDFDAAPEWAIQRAAEQSVERALTFVYEQSGFDHEDGFNVMVKSVDTLGGICYYSIRQRR